jgi:hypothetical protein
VSIKFRLEYPLLLLMLCAVATHAMAQQVKLSATSLNFGSHTSGSFGPQTITLSNNGSANLVVSAITASGGFSQTNNCSTLRPGESCAIGISFISEIVATTNGVLVITDNSASSSEIVTLSGNVLAPVALTPATLSFGNISVGASMSKSVTLTANASAFGIASINASGDYSQINGCPTTLSAGQSCTINVTFRPRANGTRAGVLAVASKDNGFTGSLSGFATSLSGTGVGGTQSSQVSLQPATLNFGPKNPFDIFQHTQTVTLTNTSANTSLTVHSVSTLGPIYNLTPFYQVASTNCIGILAPGAQCNVQIVQSPASNAVPPVGAAGSLTIVDSDTSSPNVVPLTANILPELRFTPAALSFPAQAVGTTSAVKTVTVSYDVDHTGLSLLPLSITSEFSLVSAGANPCGSSPNFVPGQTCTVGVTFTPQHAESISGAVTFNMYPECEPQIILDHQPCPNAQVINLSGTGK